MSLLTFQEARESHELANVLGVCGNSSQAKAYINQATRILMKRGNFWGTVQLFAGCIYNDCITWPRYVGTVLAINPCDRPVAIWNNWYSFVPFGPGGAMREGFNFGAGGCLSRNCCQGKVAASDVGTVPVFNQVPCGKSFYIRAYPQTRNDIGKKITIFGLDSGLQPIFTKRSDGTFQEGVELTLAVPFASTPMLVSEITRVHREKTQKLVHLFQYDPNNNVLLDCAVYEPTETDPDYRFSRIHNVMQQTCCKCPNGAVTIKALVKLQFVPVESDLDRVLISNLDALSLMVQSIREREATHVDIARGLEVDAIHDLNLELRDKFPIEQTPISINPFGSALPRRHGIGRLV